MLTARGLRFLAGRARRASVAGRRAELAARAVLLLADIDFSRIIRINNLYNYSERRASTGPRALDAMARRELVDGLFRTSTRGAPTHGGRSPIEPAA
jgi:hypothetical protein